MELRRASYANCVFASMQMQIKIPLSRTCDNNDRSYEKPTEDSQSRTEWILIQMLRIISGSIRCNHQWWRRCRWQWFSAVAYEKKEFCRCFCRRRTVIMHWTSWNDFLAVVLRSLHASIVLFSNRTTSEVEYLANFQFKEQYRFEYATKWSYTKIWCKMNFKSNRRIFFSFFVAYFRLLRFDWNCFSNVSLRFEERYVCVCMWRQSQHATTSITDGKIATISLCTRRLKSICSFTNKIELHKIIPPRDDQRSSTAQQMQCEEQPLCRWQSSGKKSESKMEICRAKKEEKRQECTDEEKIVAARGHSRCKINQQIRLSELVIAFRIFVIALPSFFPSPLKTESTICHWLLLKCKRTHGSIRQRPMRTNESRARLFVMWFSMWFTGTGKTKWQIRATIAVCNFGPKSFSACKSPVRAFYR